jgi:hypothetical protein
MNLLLKHPSMVRTFQLEGWVVTKVVGTKLKLLATPLHLWSELLVW